MFWYLLSRAGLIDVPISDLKDDSKLHAFYNDRFNQVHKLGFINIVDRPTRVVSMLAKGEEVPGRARINRIIKTQKPKVVCFVGKVVYEKFTGLKKFDFGWKEDIFDAKAYVMHFPLRGEAIVRIRELKLVAKAARDSKCQDVPG